MDGKQVTDTWERGSRAGATAGAYPRTNSGRGKRVDIADRPGVGSSGHCCMIHCRLLERTG